LDGKKRCSRRRGPGGEAYSETADATAFRRFDLRNEFSDTEAMLEPQKPSFWRAAARKERSPGHEFRPVRCFGGRHRRELAIPPIAFGRCNRRELAIESPIHLRASPAPLISSVVDVGFRIALACDTVRSQGCCQSIRAHDAAFALIRRGLTVGPRFGDRDAGNRRRHNATQPSKSSLKASWSMNWKLVNSFSRTKSTNR